MVGPQCVEWSENKDPQLPKMIEEQVLAREGDETSVVVDVADRLGIDIVTGDSNNGTDVQSEVGVLVQEDIAVRIEKQGERDIAEIDNVLLAVRRSRREPKPTWILLELREFLSRKAVEDRVLGAFAVNFDGVNVSQIFHEIMKDPNVW